MCSIFSPSCTHFLFACHFPFLQYSSFLSLYFFSSVFICLISLPCVFILFSNASPHLHKHLFLILFQPFFNFLLISIFKRHFNSYFKAYFFSSFASSLILIFASSPAEYTKKTFVCSPLLVNSLNISLCKFLGQRFFLIIYA